MNVIETLIKVQRICEAYGATFHFTDASRPIICTLPGTVVTHLFADELLNFLGIYSDIDGCKVTFTLQLD